VSIWTNARVECINATLTPSAKTTLERIDANVEKDSKAWGWDTEANAKVCFKALFFRCFFLMKIKIETCFSVLIHGWPIKARECDMRLSVLSVTYKNKIKIEKV